MSLQRHRKGLAAARQAYIQGVRKSLDPTAMAALVVEAYVTTQGGSKAPFEIGPIPKPKAERRGVHAIYAGLPGEVRELVRRVAATSGVKVSDILGDPQGCSHNNKSPRPVAEARRAIWKVLRRQRYSYPAIGRMFDRDHSTIQRSVKDSRKYLPYDSRRVG